MTRGSPDRRNDLGDEGMEPAADIAWRRVTNRHEVQRGRPTVARPRTENRLQGGAQQRRRPRRETADRQRVWIPELTAARLSSLNM
jgi:hypothetical protein